MTLSPDLAFLRLIASNPRGFTPQYPSHVRRLDALVRAGYAVKADAGRWCVTTEGKAMLEKESVK